MQNNIHDAHIRDQALDISQSFIVQAPAGSGKTELLTQRYLKLLAHAQKAPEEIIAITFTRKAASEMRARIMSALQFSEEKEPDKNDYRHTTWKLAKNALEKNKQQGWAILQNPNRLRILTIDALSAFLCRQTPLLSQMGGAYSVSNNPKEYYQLAAKRLMIAIAEETTWQPQLEQLLLHLDNRTDLLENLLTNLLFHRDQWLPAILHCHYQAELKSTLENSLQNIVRETLQIAAETMPSHVRQQLVLLARQAGNYFLEKNEGNAIAACAYFTWTEKPSITQFNHWFGLANLLLTKSGEWRKTIDVRSGFEAKDNNKSLMLALLIELSTYDNFKKALNAILLCPPCIYSDMQWQTLQSLLQLLPLLATQLQFVFREKGAVDFLELNLKALNALGEAEAPTDLALYLDYQIRHFLIDEFQDTSLTHFHLLEKIILGWEKNDGRSLFLVGDPMQSIYRFRNAEVGLFMRAQQQGVGHLFLKPLTLTMNFRSQEKLISWFNDSFSKIFPSVSDIATGSVPYTASIAAKPPHPHHTAQLYPIMDGTDEDEATLMIEKIQSLHTDAPSDSIAILVRSRNHVEAIIKKLREKKLSFQAIDIESLTEKTVIQDLLTLTRALLHRGDRIAWLSLLRSPFCGLTLNDLEQIAKSADKKTIWQSVINSETLSSDAIQRINRLKNILTHAFDIQTQLPMTSWIKGVWLAMGGPACVNAAIDLEYANAFFDLIEQCSSEYQTMTIEQLTRRLSMLFANSKNNASIQIMTIHKSKGLEFDHVFLPGLHKKSGVDDSLLFRFIDRPNIFGGNDFVIAPIKAATESVNPIYHFLKKTDNNKQEMETTRILYVAATRAKKSLHLFASIDHDISAPRSGSFLEKLWPMMQSIVPTAKSCIPKIVENEIVKPKNNLIRIHANWEMPITIIEKAAIEYDKSAHIHIDPHPDFSSILGTFIHEIIQIIAENPDHQLPIKQYQARLFSLGILPQDMQKALELVHTAINTIKTDARARWILSKKHHEAKNEWPLTLHQDNATHYHIIDRSFVDKNNDRWIIDYKTAMPKKDELRDIFLQRQFTEHKKQLAQYGAILSKMDNRSIRLGLYFPLCGEWVAWDYEDEQMRIEDELYG